MRTEIYSQENTEHEQMLMKVQEDGSMDGWMDGWMDGMDNIDRDGQMDDRQIDIYISIHSYGVF